MPRKLRLREDTPPAVALKLESPQAYVLQEFENAGLSLGVVATTLLEVMQSSEEGAGANKVAAARLFFDVTVGRAASTTNSRNLHLHAKSDKFFDEDKFGKTPPPKVE